MSSFDFLSYSVGIGFLVLVGFVSYSALSLSKTLKQLTSILEKVDDITKDVDEVKNLIKGGVMALVSVFLNKSKKSIEPVIRKVVKNNDK